MRDSSSPSSAMRIIILGMLSAFGMICTDIYLPALPEIAMDLEASAAAVQLSLSSCFLGLALGQIVFGPLSDAYGRRPLLLSSLVLFATASVLCALSPNIGILVALRFLQGLAGSGGLVLARAIACDLFAGPQLASFMSLLVAVSSVAPLVGPLLGSALTVLGSFRIVFWFLAAWGALLYIGSQLYLPETCQPDSSQPAVRQALTHMGRELRNFRFVLMVTAISLVMGGFFGYLAASPFVFQNIYGFSPVGFALIFATVSLLHGGMAILSGQLSKFTGNLPIVKISMILMALSGGLLLYMSFNPPLSAIPVTLVLFFYVGLAGNMLPTGFAAAMSVARGAAGTASGIFGVTGFVFAAAAAPLVGIMGEHSMLPLGACMTGSAIGGLILFRLALWGIDPRSLDKQRTP